MSEAEATDVLDELVELLADLEATVGWLGLQGAHLLPRADEVEPTQGSSPQAGLSRPTERRAVPSGSPARSPRPPAGGRTPPAGPARANRQQEARPSRQRGSTGGPVAPGTAPPLRRSPAGRSAPQTQASSRSPGARSRGARSPAPEQPRRARRDGAGDSARASQRPSPAGQPGLRALEPAQSSPSAAPPSAAPPSASPPRSPPSPAQANPAQVQLGGWNQYATRAPGGRPPPSPAAERLQRARTLKEVRAVMGDCQRCGLCEGRQQLVYGEGSPEARLMVVGAPPSGAEDQSGRPFSGAHGETLDKMLLNVLGLPRSQVYVTNVVKCRPPDDRIPHHDELKRCNAFLQAQLQVVRPSIVLAVGSITAQLLLDSSRSITSLRGKWQRLSYPGGQARVMAIFHPAHLRQKRTDRSLTFDDLKLVRSALDALGGAPGASPR